MKIYIATDHRGIKRQQEIIDYLKNKNIDVQTSLLPHNDTDDYVDFAIDVANKVSKDSESFGILICGTGIGMSIAANKVKGIRAARCTTVEDAYHTRNDNNSNVLCIGYNLDIDTTEQIIDKFINTDFSIEERHHRRVNKIIDYENGINNEN